MSGAYDPVELRRRIAVCFSVGELRALAEALGVGGIAWDRGIDEAAREIVRQSERYAGLPALVAKLRETRPLVEWPEPAAAAFVDPHGAVPVTQVAEPVGAPPEAPPALGQVPQVPPLSASPGTFGAPLPPPARSASPPAEPARAPWPGTTPAAPPGAEAARGVDPRILVAVAGLMLAAAIVAYLAGRASSPVAGPPSTPSAATDGVRRTDGVAGRTAAAISRSFANLARVCELPASAGGNELVFRRVFERCGPSPLPRRTSASPPPPAQPDPTDTTPPPDRVRAPRAARPEAPAPAPARGCMGQCDAAHAACRGRCGSEPTETSAYEGWNRCQGRCLSDESRCRLACH